MSTISVLLVHKNTKHKYYDWCYSWAGEIPLIIDRLEYWITSGY